MKAVAGIYRTSSQLRLALERLDREAGTRPLDLQIVVGDADGAYAACPANGVAGRLGQVSGIAVGSVGGWITGWLAKAAGLLAARIPGWWFDAPRELPGNFDEPALLATAVVGALLGGRVGAQAGRQFDTREAQAYRAQVAQGRILFRLEVPTIERALWAVGILQHTGAEHIRVGRPRR